ncbi:uncharacterized protein MYCFIDRAFT_141872 [Pseudocercospora fijiensis CIRAD86]|uniref:Dynamin GTPase n=1 Tax=Pseudocercospora fijiensis (strain CIRAD86) TaxID=383855 RepID=M3A5U8_PSEFD|nr:uncharacterized protein MYCFIDRAFT_141872 [Pseudocercospora fijiensis CIRAD86]EME80001.1 hypothetical protein MYCFIDRAFT_141872 [Pseudocercospora fijiensis CIRAD86]
MATDHYGLGEPRMLEKIDKLFACGVGELVDLPQIVVVGDQSSGKSSVLEGLIKKPLPRDSGLCTRFATQIVFRRAPASKIDVSIIPSRDAKPEHASRARGWGKAVEKLDSKAFIKIMDEVHEVMGLKADNSDTEDSAPSPVKPPTFSNDVLRLEISGPDQEHLSVIDVPGIFKSTTVGLTTKTDIDLVRNMVKNYMDNPRSVMLAVIPANVDVATQEILELANDADPHGDRTLGVLTKPDLVDKGAEPRVIDLVDGRARPMKLGWHIIRNPGQMEMADTGLDRGALEANFFRSQAPWNTIEKDKVGIDALRVRLKDVLSSLVKREFPKVRTEIKNRLENRNARLETLGPERSDSSDQRAFLTKLATRFQRLVSLALSANHGADNAFSTRPQLRIAPAAMARMKLFSDEMAENGHTYAFLDHTFGTTSPFNNTLANVGRGPQQQGFPNRKIVNESVELVDILQAASHIAYPEKGGIKGWLTYVFKNNRGFELGTFNTTILATVMKKQSSKWAEMSLAYVSDIIVMVHNFIVAALEAECGDVNVREALMQILLDELLKRYQKSLDAAKFLLEVESTDTPFTLNHYFNDNLQKTRHEKVHAGLKRKAFELEGTQVVRVDQAAEVNDMSNDEHVVQEIHDILKSYYKVTRKTFVDNVCKQATNHYLLTSDQCPLALFSPILVGQMSETDLEEIAGELPEVKRTRAQLKKEITSLAQAVKILSRA